MGAFSVALRRVLCVVCGERGDGAPNRQLWSRAAERVVSAAAPSAQRHRHRRHVAASVSAREDLHRAGRAIDAFMSARVNLQVFLVGAVDDAHTCELSAEQGREAGSPRAATAIRTRAASPSLPDVEFPFRDKMRNLRAGRDPVAMSIKSMRTTFRVPSHSMRPTLELGQQVSIDPAAYTEREPIVGDIVVLHPPLDWSTAGDESLCAQPRATPSPDHFIKRVVAGPGDAFRCAAAVSSSTEPSKRERASCPPRGGRTATLQKR